MRKNNLVLGIDPGIAGAFVVTDGVKEIHIFDMPLSKVDPDRKVSFFKVKGLLELIKAKFGPIPVYLERALPMAMGSKGAFNYGRGFEAIVISLEILKFPLTLIEPSKWAKEMHQGISADLKPKAKSALAVDRLFPALSPLLPKKPKGGAKDGPIDALLIAGYGIRRFNRNSDDFF